MHNKTRFQTWFICVFLVFSSQTFSQEKKEEALEQKQDPQEHFKKFTVTKEAPTLGEISRFVYGTTKRWQEIAEWNNLKPPYMVREGQELLLKESPKITPNEGSVELNKMWKQQLKLDQDRSPAAAFDQGEMIVKSYSKPTTPNAQAEAFFQRGQQLYQQNDFKGAAESFRKSREVNKELISSWIFEMQSLKKLGQIDSEEKTRLLFLKNHPGMSDLPSVRMPASTPQPSATGNPEGPSVDSPPPPADSAEKK